MFNVFDPWTSIIAPFLTTVEIYQIPERQEQASDKRQFHYVHAPQNYRPLSWSLHYYNDYHGRELWSMVANLLILFDIRQLLDGFFGKM